MKKARVKEQLIGQDTIIVKHVLRHIRTLLAKKQLKGTSPPLNATITNTQAADVQHARHQSMYAHARL